LEQGENEGSFGLITGKLNELESCSKLESWRGPPSVIMPNPTYMPCSTDQVPLLPEVSNLPKVTFHTDLFLAASFTRKSWLNLT
jgi:hypothetical protein